MGKGSIRRPRSVDRQTYVDNWERIFGNVKASSEQETHPGSAGQIDKEPGPAAGEAGGSTAPARSGRTQDRDAGGSPPEVR